MRKIVVSLAMAVVAAGVLLATPTQTQSFLPVADIRPGMVGVGRTVFTDDRLEEFRATILGVLRNVMGPNRDLILARLEGGPLANTGVIQGMSGSPVYVDGRLIGAVSYSLGSFSKEPLAGITPIAEMTADVDSSAPRSVASSLAIDWPATSTEVFAALTRIAKRASAPLGHPAYGFQVIGPANLADLAPQLRPIGSSLVMSGFVPEVSRELQDALGLQSGQTAPGLPATGASRPRLRPGDPVGMSLVRGDLEMGSTGTVTHVDGARVYAFGHPFLSLGPATLPMTEAHVFTVLPSLDSSMKIASLGSVIGTVTQDRATAVGGTLGAGPRELEVRMALRSERGPARRFTFYVANDAALTPLFTYVSVLNALTSYERQSGVTSIAVKGQFSFGADGVVTFDDIFSGEAAVTSAAGAIALPLGAILDNDFKLATAERLDVDVETSEVERSTTIERVWLDTVRPAFGGTYTVQVQLQDYRGDKRIVSLPITMPSHADGPLTLLVSDAATLGALEQRELRADRPTSWAGLLARANDVKRNNRIYVRLIANSRGTVVAGDNLSSLPASVQSAIDTDASVSRSPLSRAVLGSWEHRLDTVVRGSRELTVSLRSLR